ncbi:hypothetical protein [Pantoea sp. App145]|uniref:hypothetical protein n=1 Tax=Pantoea sp. App145 TaxID=3071567 RepID=UPI003A7FDB07
MSRDSPQRRKAQARNGVAPHSPAGLLPGCRERRQRRDRAAHPARMLLAIGLVSNE